MGLRFPGQKYGHCFFVTTTFANWASLGDIPGFYERLAETLTFCVAKYHAHLIAYVFMPNHIHLLIAIDGDHLGDFMRDFKKYVAQKIARDLRIRQNPIWQHRYDRFAITSERILRTKLEYIHNNPVKASLVKRPSDWQWSSAREYLSDLPQTIPIWKEWA